MLLSTEIWRDVPGYEGRYQVSSEGRVRNRSGRVFKPMVARKVPYRSVVLIDTAGESRRRMVHLLVLEAFVGPRPEGNVGRHLNGRAYDNSPGNLAWGTVAENVADRTRHGTENIGVRNPRSKLTKEQATEIRESAEKGTVLAARYGISRPQISAIRSGRSWS